MARQVNSLAAQLAVGVSSFLTYFFFIQSSFAIWNACKGPFFLYFDFLGPFFDSYHFIVLKSHCFGIAYTLALTQFLRAWCHKTCNANEFAVRLGIEIPEIEKEYSVKKWIYESLSKVRISVCIGSKQHWPRRETGCDFSILCVT